MSITSTSKFNFFSIEYNYIKNDIIFIPKQQDILSYNSQNNIHKLNFMNVLFSIPLF